MLFAICSYLKNFFIRDERDIHTGEFTIENGHIEPLDFLKNGQYFRIVGSALNDGVYQYGEETLLDEEFDGAIWAMYVPADFVILASEISSWVVSNADTLNSPYQSESFGGYSYSKGNSASGTGAYSWQDQFAARLNQYRRLSVL
jgi:hypothetical protein